MSRMAGLVIALIAALHLLIAWTSEKQQGTGRKRTYGRITSICIVTLSAEHAPGPFKTAVSTPLHRQFLATMGKLKEFKAGAGRLVATSASYIIPW